MARSNTGSTSNWYSNATNPAPAEAAPLSISAWFYPANLTATMNLVVIGDSSAGAEYFALIFDGANSYALGDNKVVVETASTVGGGVGAAGTSTTIAAANTWNHVAGVIASATSRAVYLNGGGKATNATSKTPIVANVNHVDIGGYRVGSSTFGPLNGRIAEVAIWNIDLTDAEVLELSEGANPLHIRPNNIVAYWPLVGGAATEQDLIGNFHLTQNGTMAKAEHVPNIIYPSRQIWIPADAAGGPAPVDGVVASGQGSQSSIAAGAETITAATCASGQGGQSSVSAAAETISGAVTTSSNRSQSSVAAAAETLSGIAVTSSNRSQSSVVAAQHVGPVSGAVTSGQGGQSSVAAAAETLSGIAVASGQGSQRSNVSAGAAISATATSGQGTQRSYVNQYSVTLSWDAPVGWTPTEYRVKIGTSPGVYTITLPDIPASETSIDVYGLQYNVTYYWTVVGLDESDVEQEVSGEATFAYLLVPATSGQGGQSSNVTAAEALSAATTSAQGGQSSVSAAAETISGTVTSSNRSQSSSAVSAPTNVNGVAASGQGGQSSAATAAEAIGATTASAQGGQSSVSAGSVANPVSGAVASGQGGQTSQATGVETIPSSAVSGQGGQKSQATGFVSLAASVDSAQGGQSSVALSGLEIGAATQSAQGGQKSVASEAPGILGQVTSGQGGQSSGAVADYIPGGPVTAFTFNVTRVGDTTIASTVDWVVTGSGAHPATADDFIGGVFPSGTVNFGVGQTTAVITVYVNPDADVETDEGFTVTLYNPSPGTVVSPSTADGTIINDDTAPSEIITWRGGDDAPRRGSKRRKYQDEYYETQRQAKEFLREQIRLAFEGPQAEEIAAEIKPYVPKKYRKAEYTAPPRGLDIDRIMESRRMMARIEAAAQAAIDDEDDAITALLL